jgi:hypothetical protein
VVLNASQFNAEQKESIMQAMLGSKKKAKQQCFSALANYITEEKWGWLRRADVGPDAKRHFIEDHAVCLGLVNVSEPTYADMSALYLLCIMDYEQAMAMPTAQKLIIVRQMKTEMKKKLKGRAQTCAELPADPSTFKEMHPSVWAAVFCNGPPVANKLSMEMPAVAGAIKVRGAVEQTSALAAPTMPFANRQAADMMQALMGMFQPAFQQMMAGSRSHGNAGAEDGVFTFLSPPIQRRSPLQLNMSPNSEHSSSPELQIVRANTVLNVDPAVSGAEVATARPDVDTTSASRARPSAVDVAACVRAAYDARKSNKDASKADDDDDDDDDEDASGETLVWKAMKKPSTKKAAGEKRNKKKAKKAAEIMKKPSASKKAKKRALVLGCSKCRYVPTGCSACKNPAFGGRRGSPA